MILINNHLPQKEEAMKRFLVTYYNRSCEEVHQVRRASSALDALKKICTQYGWSLGRMRHVDVETRGAKHARAEYLGTYGFGMIDALELKEENI